VLRLERHRLGPRVYLCGLRIHECALGFGVLAVLLMGAVVEAWGLTRRTEVAVLFGAWLVGKDWRDLFPSKRNTASWGLLLHRVPVDEWDPADSRGYSLSAFRGELVPTAFLLDQPCSDESFEGLPQAVFQAPPEVRSPEP
jgi:hypothetical protein